MVDDPINFIAARMQLPEDTVTKVLAGLKDYEILRGGGSSNDDKALLAFLTSIKAATRSEVLEKYPEILLEEAEVNGTVVSVTSAVHDAGRIFALRDDGTFDLGKYPKENLQDLVQFIYMNRTKPANYAGYVRGLELVEKASGSKSTTARSRLILDALSSRPMRRGEIAGKTGLNTNTVKKDLKTLLHQGLITSSGNRAQTFYSLPGQQSVGVGGRVLECLTSQGRAMTQREVGVQTGLRSHSVGPALARLREKGTVKVEGQKGKRRYSIRRGE